MPRPSTRDIVLNAAARVLSHNQGASLSEIADAAGVGRATLYRYFPTREELIRELSIQALDETDAATASTLSAGSAEEYLRDLTNALVPLGDKFHFLMTNRSAHKDEVVRDRYVRQLEQVEETVEWLKDEGVYAADIPTAWAVSVIDMLIYTAWQAVHEGRIARNEVADLLMRTLLTGLGPGPDRKRQTAKERFAAWSVKR
jgi:AcrR family transcriptional regulator